MSLFKSPDRFDLEQQILDCWRVVDDLKTLGDVYDREHTDDQVLNILIGVTELYDQKFNKLFETFETCIRQGVFKLMMMLNYGKIWKHHCFQCPMLSS